MPRRRNDDDAARLAAVAASHGFSLQRRGISYFLTRDSELAVTGDLEKVERWLVRAVAERELARV